MSFLTTKDQTQIYYNDLAKDSAQRDPVILIHGWPLNSDMWEYQATALLEEGFRVITYDRRGFGRSSQPPGGYNYEVLAEDLKEIIDQLELRNVRLVGFSMGGGEIARYLGKYGGAKIAKTALLASVLPYMLKTDGNPKGVPEKVFNDMQSELREDRPKFLNHFTHQFFGAGLLSHPVSDEMMRWCSYLAFQAMPKATHDCVAAFGKTDFRADMKAFTMPTLIIHGTNDKTVPAESSSDEAHKLIKGSHYIRFDGAPHGLFITHKNRLIEDLIEFLR